MLTTEQQYALNALLAELPSMIDAEQDDVANGFLVDAWDAVQGYFKTKRENEEGEFQDDPS